MSEPKKFTYYPGCCSQGIGAFISINRCARYAPRLGIELDEIEDWNCCGASVGHIGGGKLAQTALSGRNLAKASARAETTCSLPAPPAISTLMAQREDQE